jgi:hypothetical protein
MINLYLAYYRERHSERYIELMTCLRQNIQNPIIDRVYIVNETMEPIPFIPITNKVVIVNHPRMTFNQFFKLANQMTGPSDINILINSDIIIGSGGFEQLRLEPRQFLCISRYDIMPDGSHQMTVGTGSHDGWIWCGPVDETYRNGELLLGDFYMGRFFCDGILAHQLYQCGYALKNPSCDLRLIHLHLTNVRNYSMDEKILGQRLGVRQSHNNGQFVFSDMYLDGANWEQ